ncbi:membrane-associated phosphatidylinositol transfer protein 3-like [Chiloscyllium punctatum]|uniref:membrane-associated phosphatidylinositol transfer protein 3-like n=1 Tax=Chiloscyllium punctatum TaxID=137246 RepID=UPI003B634CC6
MKQQKVELEGSDLEISDYSPPLPQGKWLRRRTQVKIRNVAANHRACDLVVSAGAPQVLVGRFAYGPLDVVTLTGEQVDIYILTQPPSGKWLSLEQSSPVTVGGSRVQYPQRDASPSGSILFGCL